MKMQQLKSAASYALLTGGIVLVGLSAAEVHAQDNRDEARGKAVYDHWCTPCHAPGPGHPGTQSLQIKYGDSGVPSVLEERDNLTPEYVRTIVRKGILSMAPFRKTEISDAELDDIAAYLVGSDPNY